METTLSCCTRRRVVRHSEQASTVGGGAAASAGTSRTRFDLQPTAPCVERRSVSVNTELSPSFIPTLPGHSYTDPTIFEQELTRIFEAYWFAAARTSDLDGPGSFRTVDVGRENVLIVRGRDKKLRAFLNVCRHRGARVCMEKSGTGQRKLQSGYPAWTYPLDGSLVAAEPHADGGRRPHAV